MKIVLYSSPPFLDSTLPLVFHLSKIVELHFLLAVTPESWNSSLFDLSPKKLNSGIVDADSVIGGCFPAGIREYYSHCASFNLLVYNCPKSIHPASWWISRKAVRFIDSINPDVLHLDDISLRLALTIRSLKKYPICLSTHDPFAHSGETNWRWTLARNLTYKYIDHFILHNQKQRDKFAKHYGVQPEKVSSTPIGLLDIFREWNKSSVHDDGKTILFFGRMSPYKGIEVLFQAVPHIAAKIPGLRVIIAGRPVAGYNIPVPPDLPAEGKIEILGEYISNSQLADLFNQSTVVVCPYLDATQSGVVLTAYAFNKPVVATNTGGLSEYVKHMITGLLVQPGDGNQLADALINLLSDKELLLKFKSGIKDLADNDLSWLNIARQTCNIYKEVIVSRRN